MYLQQTLLGSRRHVIDGADIIDQSRGTVDVPQGRLQALQAVRIAIALAQKFLDGLFDGINGCLELLIRLERHLFRHFYGMSEQHTAFFHHINGLHAVQTFKNSHLCIFAHFRHRNNLQHAGNHADAIQVLLRRFLGVVVLLRQQDKRPVVLVSSFQ